MDKNKKIVQDAKEAAYQLDKNLDKILKFKFSLI
jgi:hypothetical protein